MAMGQVRSSYWIPQSGFKISPIGLAPLLVDVPSGKRLHSYRKSPLFFGKSTISERQSLMAM